MATTLTPEQRKLAQQLVTIGQQVGASPKEIKAALETAAVEKNFTNTGGGDADSSNWRQERASVYGGQWAKTGGALNLEASAKRFYDEARQFNRTGQYGSAGQLAAAVQRPAAQYRGRYQQQSGLAQSLLGGASPASTPGTTSTAAPASSGSGPAAAPLLGDPGQSADFTGLLGQMLARPQQQAPQVQAVAPPQFSARPALPQGFQAPSAPAQQQAQTSSGVEGALSLLGSLRGVDPASAAPSPADAGSGGQDTVVGTVTKQRAAAKQAGVVISPNARPGDPVVSGKQSVGGEHETAGLAGYPAKDYFAPAGTHAVAPISGTVIRLSGHDPADGPTNGPHGPLGYSVYIKGSDGRTYFLTHLGSRNVKPGQRLQQGQVIGTVADYDKYGTPSHIHQGISG